MQHSIVRSAISEIFKHHVEVMSLNSMQHSIISSVINEMLKHHVEVMSLNGVQHSIISSLISEMLKHHVEVMSLNGVQHSITYRNCLERICCRNCPLPSAAGPEDCTAAAPVLVSILTAHDSTPRQVTTKQAKLAAGCKVPAGYW